jgi:hypothetical protein
VKSSHHLWRRHDVHGAPNSLGEKRRLLTKSKGWGRRALSEGGLASRHDRLAALLRLERLFSASGLPPAELAF